jgi:hypothetical protein
MNMRIKNIISKLFDCLAYLPFYLILVEFIIIISVRLGNIFFLRDVKYEIKFTFEGFLIFLYETNINKYLFFISIILIIILKIFKKRIFLFWYVLVLIVLNIVLSTLWIEYFTPFI